MKVRLLADDLQFVALKTAVVHARETGSSPYDASIDLSTITMCGKHIEPSTEPMTEREIDTEMLCRRCYRSLCTYSPVAIQFIREMGT